MKKLTFLGTSNAVPDKTHQNTHLIIESDSRVILVDCPGNPFVRLDQAKIDPISITDLFLTHFHPDHVSGLPLLLIDLWLIKRKTPLTIYGLPEVLDKCKKMMALYDWEDWEGFFRIHFREIPSKGISTLIDLEEIKLDAMPVCHIIPSVGIKVVFPEGSICYSGDTAPCDAVNQLADGCDVLIHEATGNEEGHSSPADAGKVAQIAGVDNLFLIHYPLSRDPLLMIKEAKAHFSGEVFIAEDLMMINISQEQRRE